MIVVWNGKTTRTPDRKHIIMRKEQVIIVGWKQARLFSTIAEREEVSKMANTVEKKYARKSFGDPYLCKHDWAEDCFVQCGGDGIVFERKGALVNIFTSEKPLETYAEERSLPSTYTTAFFEAFPNNPATFLRGEGKTIEEAEEQAWQKFQRYLACAGHEFEKRGYTNGAGFCKHCNMFACKVFEPEPPTKEQQELAEKFKRRIESGRETMKRLIEGREAEHPTLRDIMESCVGFATKIRVGGIEIQPTLFVKSRKKKAVDCLPIGELSLDKGEMSEFIKAIGRLPDVEMLILLIEAWATEISTKDGSQTDRYEIINILGESDGGEALSVMVRINDGKLGEPEWRELGKGKEDIVGGRLSHFFSERGEVEKDKRWEHYIQ